MKYDFFRHNKNQLFEKLEHFVEKLIKENERLRETLQSYNKEEEIASLIEENKRLRLDSIHILSDEEKESLKKFREHHWTTCKGNPKIIVASTGIGDAVSVVCSKCADTQDITDHSNW